MSKIPRDFIYLFVASKIIKSSGHMDGNIYCDKNISIKYQIIISL